MDLSTSKQLAARCAVLALGAIISLSTPLTALGYGQAAYYGQASYYAQSSYYYQSSYVNGVPEGTQTFTTPGTHTFTVPTGVTSIKVFLIGGGGGGGGGAADWGGGGGGGCAGAITGQVISVTPGQTYSVTVGSGGGGAGGAAQSGGVGGVSRFGVFTAAGGGYGGSGYYGYPNASGPAGGSGGGSGGGGGGNPYPGFYAVPGSGGTAGGQTNSAGGAGKCTGSGWAINAATYITRSSFAVGGGGYAPGTYAYCGGGGGGGIVINSSTVNGTSGYAPTSGTYGPTCAPNGGTGYGAGGGGAYYSGPAYGGAGAPGAVYVEWTPVYPGSCSVSLSPNPATYSSTSTAMLTWTASNANVSMYIANVGYVTGTGGSFSVPRTETTSYSGTAIGAGGTGTCPTTLTITEPEALTASITSSLGSTINLGESTTITATFTAASGDPITATNIDQPLGTGRGADTDPGDKTYTFTPSNAGTYTFYARAETSYYTAWDTYAEISVTVRAPCTVGGVTLQSGESDTFFSSQIAPTGQLCSAVAETRTCTNGVLSGSDSYQYASCTCAPIYSCSGSDVTYTDGSCSTSVVASCTLPNYCSPGVSACVTPPPAFNAGSGTSGHLQASPSLLPFGATTRVYWDVANVASCGVTGSNGDSWTGVASGSGGKVTLPITQRTTYSLACSGLDGSSVSETAVVNVVPIFQEL